MKHACCRRETLFEITTPKKKRRHLQKTQTTQSPVNTEKKKKLERLCRLACCLASQNEGYILSIALFLHWSMLKFLQHALETKYSASLFLAHRYPYKRNSQLTNQQTSETSRNGQWKKKNLNFTTLKLLWSEMQWCVMKWNTHISRCCSREISDRKDDWKKSLLEK